MGRIFLIGAIGWCIVASACNNLKKIPAGEKLYTGAKVVIKDNPKRKKQFLEAMETMPRPKPNSKILGMRIKLSLYNLAKPPRGKGLNYLLRNKLGEPPVLLSQVKPQYNADVLKSYMWNRGFFDVISTYNIKQKEKEASIEYDIISNHRYTIHDVIFPADGSAISKAIVQSSKRSLLIKGRPFNLEVIKNERARIDAALKNRGFFYFSPDDILVQVDSTIKGQVDLYVKVKLAFPNDAVVPYRINKIFIYPDYGLTADTLQAHIPRKEYPHFTLIDSSHEYKPQLFDKMMRLEQDSLYRSSMHNITLKRLVDLGTFRYIKATFEQVTDSSRPMLNANFYLTPEFKRSIQVQLTGRSKSNNFVGSEITFSAKNRNLLHGAELFDIRLAAGFDQQLGGNSSVISGNSYTLTGQANLYIPRFVVPFRIFSLTSPYVPRTRLSVGYEFLKRPQLYQISGVTGTFGYVWKTKQEANA